MFESVQSSSFAVSFALVALVFAGCESGGSNASAEESAEQEQTDENHHHEGEHHEGEHHEGDEGKHHEGEHHEGEHHEGDEGEHHEGEHHGSKAVEVPEEGKEFDPSVSADQMPEGAWHCDMNGKVHYAAMKKDDGECPVCGMDLVQK